MKTCFLVCGPESSGNRLVGSILSRAGVIGNASNNQPKSLEQFEEMVGDADAGFFHAHHQLESYVRLVERGWQLVFLLVVREQLACCKSALKWGHAKGTLGDACRHYQRTIHLAMTTALTLDIPLEFVSYEMTGNVKWMMAWLAYLTSTYHVGLRTDNLDEPLVVDGQPKGNVGWPLETNCVHY